MIKEMLKRIIPRSVIARFRLGSEHKKYLLYINSLASEKNLEADFLFGTPLHTNLGDHLITLSEHNLLEKNCSRRVIEIPTEVFQSYKSDVMKVVPADAIIYINGGGWMGNLWPDDELYMQELVDSFSEHRVIILPQTIYYDEKTGNMGDLIREGADKFSRCNKLILCVRDYRSYVLAREYYPKVDVRLMPDIALSYSIQFNDTFQKKVVGVCLRNDRELVVNHAGIALIKTIMEADGYYFREITTMSKKRVSEEEREKTVKQKLREFYECGFVVTDRLHGMIFAYLVGTPCIVFDNKTQKVSGVYKQWLSESSNIFSVFEEIDRDKLESFIENNQEKKKCTNDSLKEMFVKFIKEIEYGRNKEINIGVDSESKM
ncbi:MAG: hypothetical protein HDR04_05775 [Lachnospiraceae bacterium]|nr:hypothetical protein [Lachnospiraceae bacterium]